MSQQNVAGAAAGGSTRPFDTDFQQQRLKAWMPTLTPRWVLTAYVLIGVIFIPIGAALLYASQTVHEESVRYDNQIEGIGTSGTVTITISHDMELPVYFYYKLSGYYQNHRRYAASRSDEQLHGESSPDLSYCTPSRHKYTDDGKVIYPCGMIAWTLFNDTYAVTMTRGSTTDMLGTSTDTNQENPYFRKRGIAYSEDVTTRYKTHEYADSATLTNFPGVQDEDFAVWMRVAGLPTFKKLHRIIGALPNKDSKLRAGDVITVQVQNQFPVAEMKAEKYIVLSTTSWLGGKSYFMGGAWIAVGLACFLMAGGLALKTYLHPPPELDSDIAGAGDGKSFEIPNVSARLVRGARASSGADEAENHEQP